MKILTALRMRWFQATRVSPFGSLVAFTFLTNVFLALVGFLTGLLVARILGPDGRGELAAIQTWPTFLATLAMLGAPDALVYYSARQPARAARLLTTSILIGLSACIPAALLGYLLLPVLMAAQSEPIIIAARNYLWILPLFAVVGMLVHPLRGRNDLLPWNLMRSFPALMWLGVLLIGMVAGQVDAVNYARWYLIGMALLFIPMSLVLKKRISGPYQPSIEDVRPILSYGLPSMLSGLPSTLNLKLDQILMVGLLSPQLLGFYVVAVAWSNATLPILSALPAVIVPKVAGSSDRIDQLNALSQMTRLGSSFAVVAGLVFAILSPLAIPLLFGSEFKNAISAGVILSIGVVFLSINQMLESGLMGLGKPKLVLLTQVVGLIFTIILLLVLMPRYNIIGAAIASTVSYFSITVLNLTLLTWMSKIGWTNFIVPNSEDFRMMLSRFRTLSALSKQDPVS